MTAIEYTNLVEWLGHLQHVLVDWSIVALDSDSQASLSLLRAANHVELARKRINDFEVTAA